MTDLKAHDPFGTRGKAGDVDLGQLKVFERVAALKSFSEAARALGLPKSTVSRSISKLEGELGTRLFQRSTREVSLTAAGALLYERSTVLLTQVVGLVEQVAAMGNGLRGLLKIATGFGFGVNILSHLIPRFMALHPTIEVSLELSSRTADLIGEGIDVAVRLGPMKDSALVATRLASLRRYMCASPRYLASRGWPATLDRLAEHDTVEMPGVDGRVRQWTAVAVNGETVHIPLRPRLSVNDPMTLYRMVLDGAGIGCLTGYLCIADIHAGRLVHLFPELTIPAIEVNLVFASSKALSPNIRAFVDFMKAESSSETAWPVDALT